jgi:hypothetical protein
MTKDNRGGSFIRWQSTVIAQFTYTVNLVLGLSVAALAFQISTLLESDFNPVSWQKFSFSISLLALVASVVLGICCVANRLLDFRATAQAARMREQRASGEEMEVHRLRAKRHGAWTWGIFWSQLGTFGVGIVLLVLSVACSVGDKLW